MSKMQLTTLQDKSLIGSDDPELIFSEVDQSNAVTMINRAEISELEVNPFTPIASEDIQMLIPHSIWGRLQQSILIMIM